MLKAQTDFLCENPLECSLSVWKHYCAREKQRDLHEFELYFTKANKDQNSTHSKSQGLWSYPPKYSFQKPTVLLQKNFLVICLTFFFFNIFINEKKKSDYWEQFSLIHWVKGLIYSQMHQILINYE